MKNVIRFILFLIYTVSIFLIKDYRVLVLVTFINILLMFIFRINVKNAINNLLKLFVFIAFTAIINAIFDTLSSAIIIVIKLLLVCNATYIYSKTVSYMEFANIIEIICYPVKIFKVNPKDIGLIVCIALAFVPILKNELQEIKNALIVKGFNFTTINVLKNIKLIFKPVFVSILQRVNELENSLRIKGYEG